LDDLDRLVESAHAFERADGMGYACAIAYVLFFIIAIFSAVEFRYLREK